MKIKGEIGQEILLSGTIKKIFVDEDGKVEYDVNVSGSDFGIWRPASEIIFKTAKEVLDEELTPEELCEANATDCDRSATDCDNTATAGDPSGEFEPMPEEYNDDLIPDSASGLPVDDEWSRPAPKKRGRPRKATVDDLIKRAKE